jgi:hypothetical protein
VDAKTFAEWFAKLDGFHRWGDPWPLGAVERIGPDTMALLRAYEGAKVATRSCEHNPTGPGACPPCADRIWGECEKRVRLLGMEHKS